jgi:hypothetical protein
MQTPCWAGEWRKLIPDSTEEIFVKQHPLAKIASIAALLLLSACGTETDTDGIVENDNGSAIAGGSQDIDWLPAGLTLPEPHTVLQNSSIGTRTQLLQVSVPDDPSTQVPAWKAALETAGYSVAESAANGSLRFNGRDVESGQIAISRPQGADDYMIQIDISRQVQ